MTSYGMGQLIGPLIFGFALGLTIAGIRAGNSRRRAAAAGGVAVPPRHGPWPTIGICVAGFYALMLVGGIQQAGASKADAVLEAAMVDSVPFQRDVSALVSHTGGSSYTELDAGMPAVEALETQGRQLRARMQGLDRSKYGRDELALVDAVVALESADTAYIDEWQRVVAERRIDFTAAGPVLAPADARLLRAAIIGINRAAVNGLAPAVAVGAMSQAAADKAKIASEAQIAELSKPCSC